MDFILICDVYFVNVEQQFTQMVNKLGHEGSKWGGFQAEKYCLPIKIWQ